MVRPCSGVTQRFKLPIGDLTGAALTKGDIHVHMLSDRAGGSDPDFPSFGYWLDDMSFGAFGMGPRGGLLAPSRLVLTSSRR